MSDIIGDIKHSIIEGMNKITYTKRCEFCGAEFTTPNHSRRYCSKRCVQATYKMRQTQRVANALPARHRAYSSKHPPDENQGGCPLQYWHIFSFIFKNVGK